MVKLTENKIRLTAKNKGIKNYQNMSKEKLLNALDKLKVLPKIYQKMDLRKSYKCRIFY